MARPKRFELLTPRFVVVWPRRPPKLNCCFCSIYSLHYYAFIVFDENFPSRTAHQPHTAGLVEDCWTGSRGESGWGRSRMRCPAPEKLEIIRLVEHSHLPVRRTLRHLGIPPATFYRWYNRYQAGGPEALNYRPSRPDWVWNRIPDATHKGIIDLALAELELSLRELAVRFTDQEHYFVSEASVYRLLKAHDLITSPAFVVVKAADEFRTKTAAPNQL